MIQADEKSPLASLRFDRLALVGLRRMAYSVMVRMLQICDISYQPYAKYARLVSGTLDRPENRFDQKKRG